MPTLEPCRDGLTNADESSRRAAHGLLVALRALDHDGPRDRDARGGEHLGGHRLVHGQGRGEHAGTDVRDAHDLEHALKFPSSP